MSLCAYKLTHYYIAHSILAILFLIVYVGFTIKYIQQKSNKLSKFLFHVGLIFCITSSLLMAFLFAFGIVLAMVGCYSAHPTEVVLGAICTFLYYMHIYLLWLILVIRLWSAFRGSAYKLSQMTIAILIMLFAIPPSLLVSAQIANKEAFFSLFLTMCIFHVIIPILLTTLFISKLLKVRSGAGKTSTDKLLPLITKTTILCAVSAPTTILWMIIYAFAYLNQDDGVLIGVSYLVTLIDVATNYLCMMLTHNAFDGYYTTIFGFLHTKCNMYLKEVSDRGSEIDSDYHQLIEM
eukprot:213795_1